MDSITKIIFFKEFKGYFSNPIGFVFLIVFLLSSNYLAFAPGWGNFFIVGQADLRGFFQFIPYIFIILTPAVAMRLWAEERSSGTIELLFTLPVTRTQAIAGKFLAAWLFTGLALALTFPLVGTLYYLGGRPDFGVLIMGYFSAFLLAGTYLAIGHFFSVVTKHQVVSFIISLLFMTFLVLAGSPPVLDMLSRYLPAFYLDFIESLSLLNHFESMQKGVLELKDLVFFALQIGGWLLASACVLEEVRAE